MKVNYRANETTQFNVFTPDQLERIFTATLEVLQRTGVDVYEEESLNLLRENGALVEGKRARIPSWMVRQALESAPSEFPVFHRDGSGVLRIRRNDVHFGPGPTCPYFLDPVTGQRRPYVRKDASTVAKVCDALPHIHFVESLGVINDVMPSLADTYEFADMIMATSKPIVAWSFSLDSCRDIHQIAMAVAGGEKEFKKRPNYIFYAEPSSPLFSGEEALQKLLYCAENSIPLIYTPCPISGGTAPATLAGVLVTAAAESLHGLVIAQLKRKGAPFIMGGVVSIMDMAKTTLAYGAPELGLLSAGLTELSRYLGLPIWSTAGCTDSKTVDQQAAIEATMSIMMAEFSGANLVHDVGFIEGAMTGSLQQLVMADEIISMVDHLVRGIKVDDETLAVDVIDSVGPAGNFLGEAHTLANFKKQFWFPRLMDRSNWEMWNAEGKKTLGDRVQEKLDEVIASHKPVPVGEQAQKRIREILSSAEEREKSRLAAR